MHRLEDNFRKIWNQKECHYNSTWLLPTQLSLCSLKSGSLSTEGPGLEFSGNRSAILTVLGDKFKAHVVGQGYDSDTMSYFNTTA